MVKSTLLITQIIRFHATKLAAVIELQQPYEENIEEVIEKFLFIKENIEKKKEVLYWMWKRREENIKSGNQQN